LKLRNTICKNIKLNLFS